MLELAQRCVMSEQTAWLIVALVGMLMFLLGCFINGGIAALGIGLAVCGGILFVIAAIMLVNLLLGY